MKPTIGISIGDFNGIGPEIILKGLSLVDLSASTPLIISPREILDYYTKQLSIRELFHVSKNPSEVKKHTVNILDMETGDLDISPGTLSTQSGLVAMHSIEKGIEFALNGNIKALVTAPISKEAVNLAGFNIPGHTEFLAEKTHADQVLMLLVNEGLRVALTTVHIPVSRIAESVTQDLILEKLQVLSQSLISDFGISSPAIAVLGLNPHSGDGGVIGKEEITTIAPAIEMARNSGIDASGPFPADGFFGQKLYRNYDAVLAMYHDQGLAPFKLLSFGKGVNFSAGLPIIRTSPDHGTAFNIAGQGVADASSFVQAYQLAVQLAEQRK